MPISRVSKVFGSNDAKLYVVTADPAGAPPTTYGAAIDIPGIKSVALSGTVETKELRGDHQLLDADSVLKSLTVTLNWAKASFDVMDALIGGTITDSGTGAAEISEFTLLGTDALPFFKIEAKAQSVDIVGGDAHLVLYKGIAAGFPFAGLAEEDYQTQSMAVTTMSRLSDQKWMSLFLHETAVALSA